VLLQLKPGADFAPSDVPANSLIVVRLLVNNIPVGGMSYLIDPTLKAPPRELPEKPGKECDAEAKALLDCLCIPSGEVKSVRVKRVTLDIILKDDCN
jgi:hypothetical protein